jgi:hypothetical protein
MLAPTTRAVPASFPFDAPHAFPFYFARNAVWYGTRLLGLAGREVLVPAYHHGVEVAALVDAGATPRFVRVDGSMQLDLEDLRAQIGPRTGAIYVIHYAGFPQPMDAIVALAQIHRLRLIEDCALALYSTDGRRPLGSYGDVGIFCLYKTLPVPNGGVLVLNAKLPSGLPRPVPPPLASTVSHLASGLLANAALRLGEVGEALRGATRQAGRAARRLLGLPHVATGTARFDRANLDLGMSRLSMNIVRHVDAEAVVAARRQNYFLLLGKLRDLAPPIFGELPAGVCPLFYPLACGDKQGLRERLAADGVETIDFWRWGHPGCPADAFPEVARLRQRVLELPIHQDLGPDDMAYLADRVRRALA